MLLQLFIEYYYLQQQKKKTNTNGHLMEKRELTICHVAIIWQQWENGGNVTRHDNKKPGKVAVWGHNGGTNNAKGQRKFWGTSLMNILYGIVYKEPYYGKQKVEVAARKVRARWFRDDWLRWVDWCMPIYWMNGRTSLRVRACNV